MQMETFKAAPGEASPSDISVLTYDATGRPMKRSEVETYVQDVDIEASPVDEYKNPNLQ